MSDESGETSENTEIQEAEVEYAEKQSFYLQRLRSKNLKTMRREVADWLTKVLGKEISSANVLNELKTGEVLLQCAKCLHIVQHKDGNVYNELESLTPDDVNVSTEEELDDPQIVARCRSNIAKFLSWCEKVGVKKIILFESEDLVLKKNEHQVLNCILKLTELFAKYGIEPPKSVKEEMKHKASRKWLSGLGPDVYKPNNSIINLYPKDEDAIVEASQESSATKPRSESEVSETNDYVKVSYAQVQTVPIHHYTTMMEDNAIRPEAIVAENGYVSIEPEIMEIKTTKSEHLGSSQSDDDIHKQSREVITSEDFSFKLEDSFKLLENVNSDKSLENQQDLENNSDSKPSVNNELKESENFCLSTDSLEQIKNLDQASEVVLETSNDFKETENLSLSRDLTTQLESRSTSTSTAEENTYEMIDDFKGVENKSYVPDIADNIEAENSPEQTEDEEKQNLDLTSIVDDNSAQNTDLSRHNSAHGASSRASSNNEVATTKISRLESDAGDLYTLIDYTFKSRSKEELETPDNVQEKKIEIIENELEFTQQYSQTTEAVNHEEEKGKITEIPLTSEVTNSENSKPIKTESVEGVTNFSQESQSEDKESNANRLSCFQRHRVLVIGSATMAVLVLIAVIVLSVLLS